MSSISSLYNIHKIGLFGDHQNKDENKLIKIKEIKNINLFQIVRYKNSNENLSNFKVDGLNLSEKLKTSSNSSTRILWMGPNNWLIISNSSNLFQEISKNLSNDEFAITDLSHSKAIIELSGKSVREVLKKGCPINFNDINENESINSIFNGIAITLDFINDKPDKIRVMCLRSFGESLYHSITDASLEFGYKAI